MTTSTRKGSPPSPPTCSTGEWRPPTSRLRRSGRPSTSRGAERKATEAVTFLSDNWHPRVGVVGLGAGAEIAGVIAASTRIDALVTWGPKVVAGVPTLALPDSTADADEIFEFLAYNLS